AVAAVTLVPRPGDGRDDPAGVHLADRVPLALADVGVALTVHADRPRPDDHCLRRRSAVADLAAVRLALRPAGAGKGGHGSRFQVEPADAPVGHVRDQQAALAVQAAVVRLAQAGTGRRAAVAGVILLAVARDRRDDAGGPVHLADDRVEPVHDEQV